MGHYERDADSLTTEQNTRIRLADNAATEIDLTGFFTSRDGQLSPTLDEEIRVQEDASAEQLVDPKKPLYSLASGTKEIVISKRVIRKHASEPVSAGYLPLQFALIRVDWPLLRTHAVTLALQRRENPNSTWPFILPIENKDDAYLSRILMPRYGTHFVQPAMDKITTTASADELTPTVAAGNLRVLAPGSMQTIRVELLPRYLSNAPAKK